MKDFKTTCCFSVIDMWKHHLTWCCVQKKTASELKHYPRKPIPFLVFTRFKHISKPNVSHPFNFFSMYTQLTKCFIFSQLFWIEKKSSIQRKRFCMFICQLKLSIVWRLRIWIFSRSLCCKVVVKSDWIKKMLKYVLSLGFLLKKNYGFTGEISWFF